MPPVPLSPSLFTSQLQNEFQSPKWAWGNGYTSLLRCSRTSWSPAVLLQLFLLPASPQPPNPPTVLPAWRLCLLVKQDLCIGCVARFSDLFLIHHHLRAALFLPTPLYSSFLFSSRTPKPRPPELASSWKETVPCVFIHEFSLVIWPTFCFVSHSGCELHSSKHFVCFVPLNS